MSKPDKLTNQVSAINYETLDAFVGYQMKRAFNLVQADLLDTLKPFDLRMLTYTALVLIVDNHNLSQTQLANAMDVERANLVVIVDELEKRKLIVRDRVPTERRVYALNATLIGRRLLKKAVKAVVAHEARLFSLMPKNSLNQLVNTLAEFQAKQTPY